MLKLDVSQVVKIALPIVVALASGIWALLRFRRSSPYSSERAKRYEEAYLEICIGTVPRMSSYDWKKSAAMLGNGEVNLPPIYRELITTAENRDSRYASYGSPAEDAAFIRARILKGEEVLNNHRLYIEKHDRDLFRDYLALAAAYADSDVQDQQILDAMFKLRDKLASITQPMLKAVYK
jgi:hypothetical protein